MGWVAVLALAALASISVSVVVDAGLSVWRGAPSQRAVGIASDGVPGALLRPDHGVVTVPAHPAVPKTRHRRPASPGPAGHVLALPAQPVSAGRVAHHHPRAGRTHPRPPGSGPASRPPVVPPQIPVPHIPVAHIPVPQIPAPQLPPTVPVLDLPGQPAFEPGTPVQAPQPPQPDAAWRPAAAPARAAQRAAAKLARTAQKLAARQTRSAQKLAAEQARAAQKLAREQAKVAQHLVVEQSATAQPALLPTLPPALLPTLPPALPPTLPPALPPTAQPDQPVATGAPDAPDQTTGACDSTGD